MTNLTNGHKFSHEELLKALQDVEDRMDILLTPYFLLHKTAECVKYDKLLEGDGIDVGIRDKAFTQYMYDILKANFGLSPDEVRNGFTYKVGEVPVRVKVYTRNYNFFQYPDHKVYMFGTYQLPNPFENYKKAQYIVR
mgnify:CR=1 FL=1